MHKFVAFALLILLAACTTPGRYAQRHDSMPKQLPKNVSFENVTPTREPYNAANLRPYKVLGKHYQPMQTAKGYTRTGIASWYGKKFHGYQTANGEIYDMYAMTAAHTTLPLPSFVRVTNLENGRQAVVRVNDRGPFHPDRIIDLSYAAALKLGMLGTGTAKVKLDAMYIDQAGQLHVGNQRPIPPASKAPTSEEQVFIQVTATRDRQKASEIASGLANLYQLPSATEQDEDIYRLRLGPLPKDTDLQSLIHELHQNGYQGAFPVRVTQ